ncbi:MAG: DUF4349 domain-containing protein [Thermoflexales bacterium]|nr:DUF4349 domain-containing protein [Thermoflexales bacterium]
MKAQTLIPTFMLSVLALASCAGAAAPAPSNASRESVAPSAPVTAPKAGGTAADAQSQAGQTDITDRLVIRTANLTLIVKDTLASLDEIGRMTTEFKGFIQSSNTTKYAQGSQATIVIKVPADKLDATLERARKMAIEVRNDQVTGQDVTAEFSDLSARIKNLEAAETQLRTILEKSTKTEDVLAVYRELTTIRGQIEQAKGRAQFLATSAAMSTVTISLIPDVIAQPIAAPGWRPEGEFKNAVEALIRILQGLGTLAIWLVVTVLPVLIILALPFVALIAIVRALNRRRPAKAKAMPMVQQQPMAPPQQPPAPPKA